MFLPRLHKPLDPLLPPEVRHLLRADAQLLLKDAYVPCLRGSAPSILRALRSWRDDLPLPVDGMSGNKLNINNSSSQ